MPTGGDGVTGDGVTGGDQPANPHTYFIAESAKFDGGGACQNSELNTITKKLRDRLDSAGWTGLRFVNETTWPEDFWEATEQPNGGDGQTGDAYRLAVYAGHGNAGLLSWGRPSPHGECQTFIRDRSRLGRFAGDNAAAVMLMTSCTLRTDVAYPNFELNAVRQVFGFHNSPYIAGGEPRDVFKRTQNGQSTKDAWLDEMEQNIALGKHSPVVLTLGVDAADAEQNHPSTSLATGQGFVESVGEPIGGFHLEWLNNGCTSVCGGPCAGGPPGELLVIPAGAPVPLVHVQRPSRTEAALAERAAALLSLLRPEPPNSTQRAQIATWARSALTTREVTVMLLPGGVQVAYEPALDRLVVDDLEAREAARPRAPESSGPERRAAELARAGEVRDEVLVRLRAMQIDLLGVPAGAEFSVGTREAAMGDRRIVSESVPFEYTFSTFGVFAGYPVFDARLELGITRRGRLSRVAASALEVRKVASAAVSRSPAEAMRALELDIAANNPGMLRLEITAARVGIAFPPTTAPAALAAPELVADYVVAYPGDGNTPVVSRQRPVSLSLLAHAAPVLRSHPDEVDEDRGDRREPAPARP